MTATEEDETTRQGPPREVLALRSLHRLITTVNSVEALGDVLDTVTGGVVDVLGFRMAAVNVLDPHGWLVALSVAGDAGAREAMLSRRIPLSDYLEEFDLADEWGLLRFVPHDRLPDDVQSSWVPSIEPLDHPDAWHPLDALYAPLHGPDGQLVGVLGVDLPEDDLRPGPLKQQVLEMYAVQAGLAIHRAQERERLRERIRLARATRQVVDAASRELDLAHVLRDSRPPLLAGFGCDRLWVRSPATAASEVGGDGDGPLPPGLSSDGLDRLAARLWADRTTWGNAPGDHDAAAHEELAVLDPEAPGDSLLVAPLGAGADCLGALVMQRSAGRAPWSEAEHEAAFQVGEELGRTVANVRLYAREHALVTELQELDRHKGELMGTITHELKNPLASILGHVELLEDAGVVPRSVGTIRRNVDRLQTLAEDLLVLASVRDPRRTFRPTDVDLSTLVDEACDDLSGPARQREVRLSASVEPGLVVRGEPEELRQLVGNLVGNAVKYCRPHGRVDVALEADGGELALRCADTGIGISEEDLATLFEEFDRSSNPVALAEPGNGLGLAIVRRIADRHGARVDVTSQLGSGTTFTVSLPRVTEPAEAAGPPGGR